MPCFFISTLHREILYSVTYSDPDIRLFWRDACVYVCFLLRLKLILGSLVMEMAVYDAMNMNTYLKGVPI